MEYKDLRNLAALMKEMELTALEYSDGGATVKMERAAAAVTPVPVSAPQATFVESVVDADMEGVFTVKSPMVGVFYAAPGADLKPFVAIGDTVHAGDVLCIIEAMKIMNEITVERDGVITDICVTNRQIVEYGQPLFRLGVLTE